MSKNSTARRMAQIQARQTLLFVGIERFCVFYMVNGRERRSPWFSSRERAHTAKRAMTAKYGADSAVVYVD